MDDGDGSRSRGGNGQDEGRGDHPGSVRVWLAGRSPRGSDSITNNLYIVRVPKQKESDLCLVWVNQPITFPWALRGGRLGEP